MPCDYQLLPHAGIQTLSPYIPGKSTDELAREQGLQDIIKLASNENPLGCSPLALQAVQKISSQQLATYPIAAQHPLRTKLAYKLAVDADMITLGDGTDALFPLFFTCFALHNNKHVLIHDYAFIAYSIHAKTLGIPVVSVPLRANWDVDIDKMISTCTEQTAIILLANPNNPVGSLVSYDHLKRLLQAIPQTTMVVLDQAYYEYINHSEHENALDLLPLFPNLIITRTFSKAYGLAGLRLGYAIASPVITDILHRALPPFMVNQAALAAVSAALDDDLFLTETIQTNARGLIQLREGVINLGLSLLPTAGNFVTIDYGKDASFLYQALLRQGIIIRPLHPYGLNNYIRVTIGTDEQISRFLDKMAFCIAEDSEE